MSNLWPNSYSHLESFLNQVTRGKDWDFALWIGTPFLKAHTSQTLNMFDRIRTKHEPSSRSVSIIAIVEQWLFLFHRGAACTWWLKDFNSRNFTMALSFNETITLIQSKYFVFKFYGLLCSNTPFCWIWLDYFFWVEKCDVTLMELLFHFIPID